VTGSADRAGSPTRWLVAAGALLACCYIWHAWSAYYVSDDGYIALRYVKNFVEGNGVVYNPGERVEGYNNFLWIILIATVRYLLPGADFLLISQVLGTLFGVLTIFLLIRFSRQIRTDYWPFALFAAAFVAAHPGLAAWATSGLETTMFAFLLLLAACCYAHWLRTGRGFLLSPVVFALAALTRPDGGLLFAATGVHLFFWERKRTGRWMSSGPFLWALAFAAIYVPYFLWRYDYYGYLLPNTAYAKVGSTVDQFRRGWDYLRSYLLTTGSWFLVIPILLLLVRRKRQAWFDYFSLLVAVHWIYVIYVGGDGLAFFRFLAYTAPLFYLLAQESLAGLYYRIADSFPSWRGWRLAVPSLLVAVLLLGVTMRRSVVPLVFPEQARWYEPHSGLHFPLSDEGKTYPWFDNYFVERLAIAARWLEANTPPDAVIASTPAGSIAFHMNRTVIDMLGLNDVHIAHSPGAFRNAPGRGRAGHEKGDGRYVLSRSPDYILMGNVAVLPFPIDEAKMESKLVLKSEHEIWDEPAFHRDYELVSVRLADRGLFQYFTFYRKKAASTQVQQENNGGRP